MTESSTAGTDGKEWGDCNERAVSDPSLQVIPGVSKRTDFSLIPSKVALLVIDIQEYLSAPCEKQEENIYLSEIALAKALPNIQRLIEATRNLRDKRRKTNALPPSTGCEVVFTYLEALTPDCRDVSLDYKLSGPFLATQLPNRWTNPAKFLSPAITPECHDIVIPKTSCSVFLSTNLHYVLRNLQIEQLVVCGQLTHQCVESAVRDAADLGYFVTVVEDACAATSAEAHQRGLLGMHGFCRTCSTDQVIQELSTYIPDTNTTISSSTTSTGASATSTPASVKSLASAPVATPSGPSKELRIRTVQDFSKTRDLATQVDGLTAALLRSLQLAGVKFLRYMTVDGCNSIRCKAVPLDRLLLQRPSSHKKGVGAEGQSYQHPVHSAAISIAQVCMAGMPSFADMLMADETGLNAQDVLVVHADWSTLRILPYAPTNAVVLGTLHHPPKPLGLRREDDGSLSPLCTRGLLQRVVETARLDYGVGFSVGAELEFCLYSAKTKTPVDRTIFANVVTLNQQKVFISDLYDQLHVTQQIPVELIHAESAPGQLEVVLSYQTNPVQLADYVLLAKETVQAVAAKHGLKSIFLPKIYNDKAGNGLHVHLSYYRYSNDVAATEHQPSNAFYDSSTGLLTQGGSAFLEGILQHLPALTALTMPTVNSFRRVGAGCWTGSVVGWAVEDKEASLRVCSSLVDGAYTNVEYKLSDATSNLYLSLAAILSCGLQGLSQNLPLRPPLGQENNNAELLPATVEDSFEALKQDELLQQVLGPQLLKAYIALRRAEAKRATSMTLDEQVQEALDT